MYYFHAIKSDKNSSDHEYPDGIIYQLGSILPLTKPSRLGMEDAPAPAKQGAWESTTSDCYSARLKCK